MVRRRGAGAGCGRRRPGQVCLLEDLADVRNHRHHGLFGALVVEPPDITPFRPGSDRVEEAWWGIDAELCDDNLDLVAYEGVLFVQDGLRLFVNGHPDQPVPDVVPGDDPEDSGQKGMSYRAVPIHRGRPPRGADPAPRSCPPGRATGSGCAWWAPATSRATTRSTSTASRCGRHRGCRTGGGSGRPRG